MSGVGNLGHLLKARGIETPVFVYDEAALDERLSLARRFADSAGCDLLYSVKASSIVGLLKRIAPKVDGFSCSSVMEARLAHDATKGRTPVHFVSPGLDFRDVEQVGEICDAVSLNSLSQWERFREILAGRTRCGLRVNPQTSLVRDERYDPCRKHSKLGVPLDRLADLVRESPEALEGISGLHIHTHCGGMDYSRLWETVQVIETKLGSHLQGLEWFNLGGGYHFDKCRNASQFARTVDLLKEKYGLRVAMEPGTALVAKAGFIVSQVVDLFDSDGKEIAVLDTSINHQLESFIYDFSPRALGASRTGEHAYILAGSTCLAGDLFGEYAFDAPLRIGSVVVFANVGAYTHALATIYNGQNLLPIYGLSPKGELVQKMRFTYEDFVRRCGADLRPSRPAAETKERSVEDQVASVAARALRKASSGADILAMARESWAIGERLQHEKRIPPPPRPVACSTGCPYCCTNIRAETTPLEAIALAWWLTANLESEHLQTARERVAEADRSTHGLSLRERRKAGIPCPLLEDGLCSAYDIRPFDCRGYESMDAGACEDYLVKLGKRRIPLSRPLFDAFREARKGLLRASRELGLEAEHLELNAALRIALETVDMDRRWLGGERVFDSARFRAWEDSGGGS